MWFECGKVGILSMNDLTLMDDDTFQGMAKRNETYRYCFDNFSR